MHCRIAELIVEIPEAGGMPPRCRGYLCAGKERTEIKISSELYRSEVWPGLSAENVAYMESGIQFYAQLLKYNGLMLHASAVEFNGKAYLFSGPCGTGKSTHTRLWQQTFGPAAQVFNDDKPALREMDGKWYAYGTPWCGKDGINQNKKVPLAGICFLKQADNNAIRLLSSKEAITKIISQTQWKYWTTNHLDLLLKNIEKLVLRVPVFELENQPEPDAAILSYKTMCKAAEELGI